jgi:hypothetical protein
MARVRIEAPAVRRIAMEKAIAWYVKIKNTIGL